MAEQEKEKELLIEITQYVDRNNPEIFHASLSINYHFGNEGNFKNPRDVEISRFTLDDLCEKIPDYIDNNKIFSLSSDSKMRVFHVPVIFQGTILNQDSSTKLPPHSKKLESIYSLIIGGENQPIPFFEKKVTFHGWFFASMRFEHVRFEDYVKNEAGWESGVEFKSCHFRESVNFMSYNSAKTMTKCMTFFSQCIFHQDAMFHNSSFSTGANFHHSTFKQEAIFIRSKFSDVANFYFVTFHKPPSFSMCAFNNPRLTNFIGVDTSMFNTKSIKEHIEENVKSDNAENYFMGRGIEYLKIQDTLDIRDTFRTIKEVLNAQANVLESQKWHKLELYTKEIELRYKIRLKELEKETRHFSQLEAQDKIQKEKAKRENKPHFPKLAHNDSKELLEINKEERLKNTIEYWQLWFYRHTSDHHTDLMRIISWVIIAIGAFGLTFFWAKCIQNPSTFSHLNPCAVNLSLWGTILLLILYLFDWIKSFFIFAGGVGLISILWIVCHKPSLIFGAVNLLEKNSEYSGLENIILAIYTLIMILLLFSLQKTARKNSIIPN